MTRQRRFEARALWQSAAEGARANIGPAIVLQLAALALVVGYYRLASVHDALASLAAWRERTGIVFSVLSTALSGGAVPFFYLRWAHRDRGGRPPYTGAQGAALMAFWGYKGFEVDTWYHLQAAFVGTGHSAGTIAVKVCFDQLGYCPALAVPITAAVYEFVAAGMGRRGWAHLKNDWEAGAWYRRRVLPLLVSNLAVWIPAVAIIYALPLPLQLPLQNLVLCFFTLVIAHQTGRRGGSRLESLAAIP